jgi:putative redox protein
MKAEIIQARGLTFAAKGESNHWVMIDGPEEFGGSSAASRPMEFILFGFAGCSGSDIASILQKKRVQVEKFTIVVKAERAEEHPKVFTKIHLTFQFTGKNIKAKDVERSIELTRTKYCPVWAMLQESIEITHSYDIQESE